ncbi:MAG: 3-phosphoserine/phosphohydroxythreonine transaminase [Casimicrobiaceae bacterium]
MSRVFNFSAGPAALPEPVLVRARDELLDWHGSGMSVMEMSHRGKEFVSIAARAEAGLRRILGVPDDYSVLFLQGGALAQNAFVPLNLLGRHDTADYVETGSWSEKSIEEARKYCTVHIAASSRDQGFSCVPAQREWQLSDDPAYVHICTNETIGGVEYHWTPDTGEVPLVADMSSHILSRPVDVRRFGLIYAGAQKNIGPAGLTVVIVRNDLLDRARPDTPAVFAYGVQAKAESMFNTPPTYAVYLAGLVFDWLEEQGGLAAMEAINLRKATLLYDEIDRGGFYRNTVRKQDRSRMNVTFVLPDAALDADFLAGAKARGLEQLKGHRSVGGMRASIYNAMPLAGVEALVAWMREFAASHG